MELYDIAKNWLSSSTKISLGPDGQFVDTTGVFKIKLSINTVGKPSTFEDNTKTPYRVSLDANGRFESNEDGELKLLDEDGNIIEVLDFSTTL